MWFYLVRPLVDDVSLIHVLGWSRLVDSLPGTLTMDGEGTRERIILGGYA